MLKAGIVSRGDWLWNPVKFKLQNNSILSEFKMTCQMILSVHTSRKRDGHSRRLSCLVMISKRICMVQSVQEAFKSSNGWKPAGRGYRENWRFARYDSQKVGVWAMEVFDMKTITSLKDLKAVLKKMSF